ncbi:MAG: single-stranded-DNA-specific exonuclease RecJ [Candidatus Paceibacterota bacterium]|jgi:single-stranded-DNA-specific exonuclease
MKVESMDVSSDSLRNDNKKLSLGDKYAFYPLGHENITDFDGYPELVKRLLFNRGIITKEESEKFLNPSYENDLHDPFLMLGMERAVQRIMLAIKQNEKIVVFGDYDSDGIPGCVIFNDFFKKIKYENYEIYIPHRHDEGYGLNKESILKISNKKASLLITVDLGITDVDEIKYANDLGIDVIVTDHHIPGTILPPAYAILNSKQEDDEYPFKMLCGAGVAFKLIQALIRKYNEEVGKSKDSSLTNFFSEKISEGWEKWLLDMVGLATVADSVPLVGENRVFAYFGLKVLRKNRRLGLQKLLALMYIDPRYLTEDDISFSIVPKINAASRMDNPWRAFELLATDDEKEAGALALHLSKINDDRKIIVAGIVKEAKATLEKRIESGEEKEIIVIGNPKWRIGVLGIVASKISEEYGKSVFVWGMEGGEDIKGSCRSCGDLDLSLLMKLAGEKTFTNFGGHEMAGGFSVSHEEIYFLEERILSCYAEASQDKKNYNKKTLVDKKMEVEDVNEKNYKIIEMLSPFGISNPKPLFYFQDLKIEEFRYFGKGQLHLEVIFKKENSESVKAISFFAKDKKDKHNLGIGSKISFVGCIEKNIFRGRSEIRLRIVEIL